MGRCNAPVRALMAGASAVFMSAIAAAQSPGPVNGQDVGFIETDLVTNVPSLMDSNGIVHTHRVHVVRLCPNVSTPTWLTHGALWDLRLCPRRPGRPRRGGYRTTAAIKQRSTTTTCWRRLLR
jgi:hypothetical protein